MRSLLQEIGTNVPTFGYFHLLAERLQSLMKEMKEKYEVVMSTRSTVFTKEVSLLRRIKKVESSHKTVKEFKANMIEA